MRKFLFLAIFLAAPLAHAACTVSGSTYTAASPSQSDVNACLALISTDNVTLSIPAGTSTWTGAASSFCNSITFEGAGSSSTVITNNQTNNLFANSNNCNNKTITFRNLGFIDSPSLNTSNAIINTANCYGCTLVSYQNSYQGPTTNTARAIWIGGTTYGVSSHDTFVDIGNQADNWISSESGTQFGNAAWQLALRLGTSSCFYYEDDSWTWTNHVDQNDSENGACVTYRHDTFTVGPSANTTTGNMGAFDHGYDSVPRSAKEIQYDHDTFSGLCYRSEWWRGGTGIAFTNQMQTTSCGSSPNLNIELTNYRSDSGSVGQAGNNKGNYCDGTISVDGNLSGITNDGWPCEDQFGRGQDSGPGTAQAAKSGAFWDNCDNGLGGCTIGGADEVDPTVTDTYSGSVQNNVPHDILINRDYFEPVTTGSGHGVGTAGVGQGTLAQRPSTCSTIAHSSGPYYWATDTQILYNCTATNTWSTYFTPYTYPNPLVPSGTSYTLTITATNGSVSGTNCANGTYSSGTSIGACTATPNAGYAFAGWSGTGSFSGASGTGTVSATLSANSTLTATFTALPANTSISGKVNLSGKVIF